MLAIIGASGKIGGATLDALLSYNLVPASQIIACTSSTTNSPTWSNLASRGVQVRHAHFDDPASLKSAFTNCTKLFLVSTPQISLDFSDAPSGAGRERQHIAAIDAARSAGVAHLYYTSLAFGPRSKAGVMRAHLRTEAYLAGLQDVSWTVLREGLYNESWPLYLGYYDMVGDERGVVPIAGDGKIAWTAIGDLGLASALVISAEVKEYRGKTLHLSNGVEYARTMKEVAEVVGRVRGMDVQVKMVSKEEYERYYIERGVDPAAVRWWSSTYDALNEQECAIDDPTLTKLLASKGRKPVMVEDTIKEMIGN